MSSLNLNASAVTLTPLDTNLTDDEVTQMTTMFGDCSSLKHTDLMGTREHEGLIVQLHNSILNPDSPAGTITPTCRWMSNILARYADNPGFEAPPKKQKKNRKKKGKSKKLTKGKKSNAAYGNLGSFTPTRSRTRK